MGEERAVVDTPPVLDLYLEQHLRHRCGMYVALSVPGGMHGLRRGGVGLAKFGIGQTAPTGAPPFPAAVCNCMLEVQCCAFYTHMHHVALCLD